MVGITVRIPSDLVHRFPAGTLVTRRPDGILYASVPVFKPGEPMRMRRITAAPGEDIYVLCRLVRVAFKRPPEPE